MRDRTSSQGLTRQVWPLRWGIAVAVLGALGGLAVIAVESMDAGMPLLLAFGALGGLIGGLRFLLISFGGEEDPRLGGGEHRAVWEGYGRVFSDFLWAGSVWLVGSTVMAIVVYALDPAPRDGTVFFVFPLILGILWAVAYGVAELAFGIVMIPISILHNAWRARKERKPFNPWWYYVAVYLAVLILSIAALIALLVAAPQLLEGYESRDLFVLIFGTDASRLDAGAAALLWITRALTAAMGIAVLVTLVLGIRRLRELRGALRDGGI